MTGGTLVLDAGRTLQVDSGATATMDADRRIFMADAATRLENAGTFNANGDEANGVGIFYNGGTGQLVHNTGTFNRSGAGTFVVDVPFDNDGTVQIATGILRAELLRPERNAARSTSMSAG